MNVKNWGPSDAYGSDWSLDDIVSYGRRQLRGHELDCKCRRCLNLGGRQFQCESCGKWVSWEEGCDDNLPDSCSNCFVGAWAQAVALPGEVEDALSYAAPYFMEVLPTILKFHAGKVKGLPLWVFDGMRYRLTQRGCDVVVLLRAHGDEIRRERLKQ